MQLLDGSLLYSASDLNNFLECEHLISLEADVAFGRRTRPEKSATAELIAGKGIEHEARYLKKLQADYGEIVTIESDNARTAEDFQAAAASTREAMERGARIIYQGVFFEGGWLGKADFLTRVETASARWPWSYEVADTKLALHTKPYFILQLSFYSEQLANVQGSPPANMHVILGDGRQESYRVADFAAYFSHVKTRFAAAMQTRASTYPMPVGHCDMCAWDRICTQQRDDDDHLSLTARIRRDQIRKLESAHINTLAQLAAATPAQRPVALAVSTFDTLHSQAQLQLRQRVAMTSNGTHDGPRHFYEILEARDQQGFGLLPPPASGDVFFDMEGDPLYEPGRSLEYLFGVFAPDDTPPFRSLWAHTPAEEKAAFESFVDYLVERRTRFPGMHVYHYAPYEKTALRRLMSTYSTREDELDDLLRAEVFVDLYAVVRQAIRISQPSYSIKKLEAFYGMTRDTETKFGGDSIIMYEQWVHDRARTELLDDIERYNQDDCRSTWMLREWLVQLRAEAQERSGPIPWYTKTDATLCHEQPTVGCKLCEKRSREAADVSERVRLSAQLLAGVEDVDSFSIHARSEDERARWTLANLIQYHRREQKPSWWRFYDRCENRDELIYADNEAIGGLTLREDGAPFKQNSGDRNLVYTYEFPDQQYKLRGDVYDPCTRKKAGDLVAIDPERNLLQIKRSRAQVEGPPLTAVIPGRPLPTRAQDDSLARSGRDYLSGHLSSAHPATLDLLLRRTPRLRGMASGGTLQPEHVDAQSLYSIVEAMDCTALFIQGPPGSGKTTKAALVIASLLRAGKRVGVLSNSHHAIHNLLRKVEEAAAAHAIRFRGLKKYGATEGSEYESLLPEPLIHSPTSNDDFAGRDWQLAAGTAWLFAREELVDALDYLFIDEAGQIALADAVAVAPSAKNLVLLGDPLQLAQVSQGSHPDGIGASALEHLLGERTTVSPETGIFLNESYRMHPKICSFISRHVYDGRLTSAPKTGRQSVEGSAIISGAGLRAIAVEHSGNAQESPEEARCIAQAIEALLLSTWTDIEGNTRLLTPEDVLVVTPYNAQRRTIEREFAKRNIPVRVGTVDKFQGQEGAVVFFSMATSSSDEMPRDVEFLFSRNRFNVAISRARCLAVLVASPRLLDLHCATVEQMALTNLLCAFVDEAAEVAPQQPAEDQLALF